MEGIPQKVGKVPTLCYLPYFVEGLGLMRNYHPSKYFLSSLSTCRLSNVNFVFGSLFLASRNDVRNKFIYYLMHTNLKYVPVMPRLRYLNLVRFIKFVWRVKKYVFWIKILKYVQYYINLLKDNNCASSLLTHKLRNNNITWIEHHF